MRRKVSDSIPNELVPLRTWLRKLVEDLREIVEGGLSYPDNLPFESYTIPNAQSGVSYTIKFNKITNVVGAIPISTTGGAAITGFEAKVLSNQSVQVTPTLTVSPTNLTILAIGNGR